MSNKREEDDGSQRWMDQTIRQRNLQRKLHGGSNPLDQRVAIQQQNDPSQIRDPYIRDLIAKRAQTPHYSSIPMDREVQDVDMDALMRRQAELQRAEGYAVPNSADINLIFNRNNQQSSPVPQPQSQQVVLREGYPIYRVIEQSFGNTVILAREVGAVNHQLASLPFILRRVVNVYVVPPNQTQINIQELSRNPQLLSQLVEVQPPPMASLGVLLVPRQAIVQPGPYGNGRNLITDYTQYPQSAGKMILKG